MAQYLSWPLKLNREPSSALQFEVEPLRALGKSRLSTSAIHVLCEVEREGAMGVVSRYNHYCVLV